MLVHVWTRDKIFPPHIDKIQEKVVKAYFYAENYLSLTFWRRNYFFLILAHLYINVNNTGTKYVRIVKQTALWRGKNGEYIPCLKYSVPIFVE